MLYYRQKVLLGLLECFGGEVSRTNFQKYLFLYTRLYEQQRSYEFVPYKYGCFSFQANVDKAKLIDLGYLEDVKSWKLTSTRKSYLKQLTKGEPKKLQFLYDRYGDLAGQLLLVRIYEDYPRYASNSVIAERILSDDILAKVRRYQVRRRRRLFATIGYEGLSVDAYLDRLLENDVRVLVDVRKNPLSRKYGFSKSSMSRLLERVGIEYVHMPELGIVSDKRRELHTAQDYVNLFDEYEHTTLVEQDAALTNLHQLYLKKRRIAITCFELLHTMCHRHKVAEAITAREGEDFEVLNI